jgi:hypothetical protein
VAGALTGSAGAADYSLLLEIELGMNPVITPTPTALKIMTATAAIATIGLTRVCVSDIRASSALKQMLIVQRS